MKRLSSINYQNSFANLAVFVSRLGLLPANISPLGSLGFFSNNLVLFILNIIIFDWLVGGFYPNCWVTYLGFLMYPLMSHLAKKNLKKQIVFLPLASLLFFFVSNLGVWFYWYPHTLTGLIRCYLLALPFYQRTLMGDLVFGYTYLALKEGLKRWNINHLLARN